MTPTLEGMIVAVKAAKPWCNFDGVEEVSIRSFFANLTPAEQALAVVCPVCKVISGRRCGSWKYDFEGSVWIERNPHEERIALVSDSVAVPESTEREKVELPELDTSLEDLAKAEDSLDWGISGKYRSHNERAYLSHKYCRERQLLSALEKMKELEAQADSDSSLAVQSDYERMKEKSRAESAEAKVAELEVEVRTCMTARDNYFNLYTEAVSKTVAQTKRISVLESAVRGLVEAGRHLVDGDPSMSAFYLYDAALSNPIVQELLKGES